jgi:hypothetical protein
MRKRLLQLPATALVLGLITISGSADQLKSSSTNDTKMHDEFRPLAELTQAWATGKITDLTILCIPASYHFPVSVTPKAVDSDFRIMLFIRDAPSRPFARKLMSVLEQINARASNKIGDVRWGLIFEDRKQTRVFSIYFEDNGTNAVVNGARMQLDSAQLSAWVNKTLSAIGE